MDAPFLITPMSIMETEIKLFTFKAMCQVSKINFRPHSGRSGGGKTPIFIPEFLNNDTSSYSCAVNKLNLTDDANSKKPTYPDKMAR